MLIAPIHSDTLKSTVITAACAALFCVPLTAGAAAMFMATTLVSDQAGAPLQDPDLVNPWGVAYSASSPFWVADNGTGLATLYTVNPATDAPSKGSLTVTIPGAGSVTGVAFNGSSGSFNGDLFLFVSQDGTVSGWRNALGTQAETLVLASPGADYRGSAIGSVGGFTYLYAANSVTGGIDVIKEGGAPDLPGNFVDPNQPSGYAPYNIQQLAGHMFVAYAQRDPSTHDEIAGPGVGFVDEFDLNGNLLRRVATGGALNAPWGLALAPAAWGDLAGALLVGNVGDGRITAYDLTNASLIGQLQDGANSPLAIDGLWALAPGNGGNAGSPDRIYFTAGPAGESHGALGVIAPVPLPGALPLLSATLALLATWRRRNTTCGK